MSKLLLDKAGDLGLSPRMHTKAGEEKQLDKAVL